MRRFSVLLIASSLCIVAAFWLSGMSETKRASDLKPNITFSKTIANDCRGFVAVDSSNHLVATLVSADEDLSFFDTATGNKVKRIPEKGGIGVFNRTNLFASTDDTALSIWDIRTWKLKTEKVEKIFSLTFGWCLLMIARPKS